MHEVHRPDRRDAGAEPKAGEIALDDSWRIAVPAGAGSLVRRAAEDFCDYLAVSMGVKIPVAEAETASAKTILLTTAALRPQVKCPTRSRAFLLEVTEDRIALCGADERGVFAGTIHLEDLMNLREAPFLPVGTRTRTPLVRMRSVHSGCGIDDFPDRQLNAIAHAGFTAIDLFVKAPDTTTRGHCDINDVIERAAGYGLDTVLYSYLRCYKHPDDPDADECFDRVFGEIFRRHPGAAAIHLVGESLDFPSKDPHTTGKPYDEGVRDGIPDPRPSPGWYTCCDYPAFVKKVADAVHRVKPEAEVILNTYNWGYMPLADRKKLLAALPREVTVQSTYDIFRQNRRGDLSCPTMDYSISAADPGYYFTSEAETAAALGFPRQRVTSNLAGATWDFGTVPYVPTPFRWAHRMDVLKRFLRECHVDSFYENHHYGWWPNVCNDLAKEFFTAEGDSDAETVLRRCAVRDYGAEAADAVVAAWKTWSGAMDHYVGSNEDQYGPWRTGPAYPFIFQPNISRVMARKEIQFPTAPGAHFGYLIIRTLYMPYENAEQSPGPLRYPVEIAELETMLAIWEKGRSELAAVSDRVPDRKRPDFERLCALGDFIRNSIRTTRNIKRWWMLNQRLQVASDRKTMLELLDRIEALAHEEIANTKETFEPVRIDSRIGWEPSMEYVCDQWHLEWKLRQMESMLLEVAAYRKMIEL